MILSGLENKFVGWGDLHELRLLRKHTGPRKRRPSA